MNDLTMMEETGLLNAREQDKEGEECNVQQDENEIPTGSVSSEPLEEPRDEGDEESNTTAPPPTTTPQVTTTTTAKTLDILDLSYASESYRAVVFPVAITMILAALAVNWVTTEEWAENTQQNLQSAYTVVQAEEGAGTSTMLGTSLLNGLVIICFLCAITFLVVALLKFRCMKILYGYLTFTFFSILFLLASEFFKVAIEAFSLHRVDKLSFWWSLFNFAIVGTLAIFWPWGLPRWLTQSYLILASVLVAWQLSQFDPWTGWILLILLSLYDLFAVLTPCGPLKALVNLMQSEDAPALPPGLLFEARLRNHGQESSNRSTRPDNQNSQTRTIRASTEPAAETESSAETSGETETQSSPKPKPKESGELELSNMPRAAQENNQQNTSLDRSYVEEEKVDMDEACREENLETDNHIGEDGAEISLVESMRVRQTIDQENNPSGDELHDEYPVTEERPREEQSTQSDSLESTHDNPSVSIPLALAKAYKLPLVNDRNPSWRRSRASSDQELDSNQEQFTPEQLCSLVDAVVPRNGGRIVAHPEQRPNTDTRYKVTDQHGNLRRIVFVGTNGIVYQDPDHEMRCQNGDDPEEERTYNDRIRLGLGDFVFYSVLVAMASEESFVSFAACFNVILTGMCITLLILAVTKHALPALPISIIAGVIAYILAVVFLQDYIESIFVQQTYV